MIQQEPLDLRHYSIIEPLLKSLCREYNLLFAEYSFANNYLFRHWHSYMVIPGRIPFLAGKFKNETPYLIPTLPPEQFVQHAKDLMKEHGYSLFPIPEDWLPWFPKDLFLHSSDMDDSDYIFTRNKLSTLAGRDLSSRRNLLHQLEKNYTVISKPITPADTTLLKEVLETWQINASTADDENDYQACSEGIEHFFHLKLFGHIAFGNDKPIGFTIGEILNSITAVIHFSKSDLSIKGVTPFLYSDFAKNLSAEIQWVNLEQDLGKLALRQAKHAYRPDKIETKWRVKYI